MGHTPSPISRKQPTPIFRIDRALERWLHKSDLPSLIELHPDDFRQLWRERYDPEGAFENLQDQFIAGRREASVGPAAINRDLRTVFNRAVRRGELDGNPFSNFERLTEDQKEIRTLDAVELQRVCGHFAGFPLVQTFLLVSLQTGCRIAKLAHLLWDDVEPSSGWLMIREKTLSDGRRWRPKSRAGIRDVWLPAWLTGQLRGKPFVWSRHLVELGAAFDSTFDPRRFVPYVQHRIADCCQATGVRSSYHDLRRTQQSWLREHGWGTPCVWPSPARALEPRSSGTTTGARTIAG